MGYQEDRLKRIALFEDTIQYCERSRSLVDAVLQTRRNTVLYKNPVEECRGKNWNRYEQPCRMFQLRTHVLEVAQRIHLQYPGCRIGILNTTSAMNPGGSVIRGGRTQEACLCRCSTLYPCLNTTELLQEYYDCTTKDALHAGACIYTPDVVCIKIDTMWTEIMKESDWFSVDVISCTAPDLEESLHNSMNLSTKGNGLVTDEGLPELLRKQMKGILQVAVGNSIEIFLLGVPMSKTLRASSYKIVQELKKILREFRYSFRAVGFVLYDKSVGESEKRT